MIIDFHTHIFSKRIRDDRETYFSGEPAFKLLYESPKSRLVGAGQTIDAMDENGVDRSVVFGFPWKHPDTFKRENDYILASIQKHPERLIGFCCFDALCDEAADEALRCINAGIAGVGELAFYESGIEDKHIQRLKPLFDLCLEYRLPILIHTNEPVGHQYPGKTPLKLIQIYRLLKAFPENTIVLAHWGGGIFFYQLLKKEVAQVFSNVYFDTAASPFLYRPEIYAYAMRLAGRHKILFGSDHPLIKPARYFSEIEKSGVSQEEKNDILGLNAKRLLNI